MYILQNWRKYSTYFHTIELDDNLSCDWTTSKKVSRLFRPVLRDVHFVCFFYTIFDYYIFYTLEVRVEKKGER